MADDVGATFGPESMAFLVATADQLILSGSRGTYHLPRTAVVKLGRGNMYPWFFSAVRLHQSIGSFPRELQFKPMGTHWRDVALTLQKLGYPCA